MAHETSEPKNLLILGIGVGSVVTLVAVLYALQSYYYGLRDAEQHEKVLGRPNPELIKLREDERRRLTGYAKLDPEGKRVRIPIDRAMGLLAQRGRDGFADIRPSASGAPAGSAPAPALKTPPAASSAPSAPSAPSAQGAHPPPPGGPAPRPGPGGAPPPPAPTNRPAPGGR